MLCTLSHQGSEASEHEEGEGEEMQAGEGLWQALVVAGEASEAGHPGVGAFDDPTLGEQHEPALGLWELDDLQADTLSGGIPSRVGAMTTRLRRALVQAFSDLSSIGARGTRDRAHHTDCI